MRNVEDAYVYGGVTETMGMKVCITELLNPDRLDDTYLPE